MAGFERIVGKPESAGINRNDTLGDKVVESGY
jgi:hypothetical protein